ncbi:sorting nexin-2-like [Symsagittifera roscoffensis]|uniref:sorting nexin-2-like n=1 Tax=Symsagittifera roscoffensis TaxID=84072 RepID=UPI00307B7641
MSDLEFGDEVNLNGSGAEGGGSGSGDGGLNPNEGVSVNLDSDDELFPAAASAVAKPLAPASTDKTAKAFADLDAPMGDNAPSNTVKTYEAASVMPTVSGIAGASESPTPFSVYSAPARKPTESAQNAGDGTFIIVSISDSMKVGDGVNAYMRFKVSTRTNLTYFKSSQFSVFRRFSDFLGLHEKLVAKHISYGRIVPPPPEKNMSGMTKVKMGKEESSSGSEFIQRRMAALERFINRCLDHPNLRNDPDMRDFLEREELPKASHTSALSGKSLMKRFSSVVETATAKPTKIPNDPDQWFEMKLVHVENLENQLNKLAVNIEGLVQTRQHLSGHSATFAKSVAMLGNTEEHTVLSRALSQLSELEERIEHLHANQSQHDYDLFCELVRDYCGLLKAVRETFGQRAKQWHEWQGVESNLLKKKESEGRMQVSGRTEKVPVVKAEIAQLEISSAQMKSEFEKISENLKMELGQFEEKRVEEFKNKLIQYLETLLESQQTLVRYWTEFIPEAKAIV